jgi:hypothetical protein
VLRNVEALSRTPAVVSRSWAGSRACGRARVFREPLAAANDVCGLSRSGGLLPPSLGKGEKTGASEDQAGQASAHDRSRDGRRCVRARRIDPRESASLAIDGFDAQRDRESPGRAGASSA